MMAGWKLETEKLVQSEADLGDGQWEVYACLSDSFQEELKHVEDEREWAVVSALRDACEASLEGVEGGRKGVRAMDTWVATFV